VRDAGQKILLLPLQNLFHSLRRMQRSGRDLGYYWLQRYKRTTVKMLLLLN
jgi:hypothetical protein